MGCVDPNGSVSTVAKQVLAAIVGGADAAAVAQRTSLPLYRVRSSLRELVEAGFLTAGEDGRYALTESGTAALA